MSLGLVHRAGLSVSVAAFAGACLLTGPVGCRSIPPRMPVATENLSDEVGRLDRDIQQGFRDNLDVLARPDFSQAQDQLRLAKGEMQGRYNPDRIANYVGTSRAFLNRAIMQADRVQERAKDILTARSAALKAGAHDYPGAERELKKADDRFRSEVGELERGSLGTERWAQLQQNYMNVELRAIQEKKLGKAQAQIDKAISDGAKKNTPNALAQAERDLRSAENVIAANRHNDAAIAPAVQTAERSSQLLTEIVAASKRPEGVINEDAARVLVLQGRRLHSTDAQLDVATQQAAEANTELESTAAAMKLNRALESARKEFASSEADVYRQGDKLLIRLKAVNFPVGRADLPAQSLPLISKVKTIAEELNPVSVVVQGHTDSTGKKQFNKVLSQERAETVAKYLAENGIEEDKVNAIGFGYEKPLASNKSKDGRAENRRVDIVITPGPTTTGSTEQQ